MQISGNLKGQLTAAFAKLSPGAERSGALEKATARMVAIAKGIAGGAGGVASSAKRAAAPSQEAAGPGRAPFLYGPISRPGVTGLAGKEALTAKLGRFRDISLRLANLPTTDSPSGGKHRADEAKLESKRWETMEGIADAEIDEAKNNYEEAKEQFKLAMRVLSEHMERMTQVTQKITS